MLCQFDSNDEGALARCLIRPVLRGGNVGPIPENLPDVLQRLVGQPMNVDPAKLRQHLSDNGIAEETVGGPIEQDIDKARFLVIHDTSSPEITSSEFQANINEREWSGNKLANWISSNTPTHVFVNRVGDSATKANFSATVGGTKYEAGKDIPPGPARQQARDHRRGLFLHIELIQPRRRSNPHSSFFDVAPTPGFSAPQLDRLALLYVVASVRSARWLLPAFHCSVDTTIPDAHDDPQNFDLDGWLNSLNHLLETLGSV